MVNKLDELKKEFEELKYYFPDEERLDKAVLWQFIQKAFEAGVNEERHYQSRRILPYKYVITEKRKK